MIINLSRDKTALVGINQGVIDEKSAEFALVNDHIYLKDNNRKMRFKINDHLKDAIINKGYIILCQKNPFNFFKVKMKGNVSK